MAISRRWTRPLTYCCVSVAVCLSSLFVASAFPAAGADQLLAKSVLGVKAWCGARGAIIDVVGSKGARVTWQDLSGRRQLVLSPREGGRGGYRGAYLQSSNCSPDGKWIMFADQDI